MGNLFSFEFLNFSICLFWMLVFAFGKGRKLWRFIGAYGFFLLAFGHLIDLLILFRTGD